MSKRLLVIDPDAAYSALVADIAGDAGFAPTLRRSNAPVLGDEVQGYDAIVVPAEYLHLLGGATTRAPSRVIAIDNLEASTLFAALRRSADNGVEVAATIATPLRSAALRAVLENSPSPVEAARPAALGADAQPPNGGTTSRAADVLLVDDNTLNLDMFRDYLEANQIRVATSERGEDAVARAAEHAYGIIVMDVQMPGIGGIEAIRRIRASPASGGAGIIAVTALASAADRQRCLDAGADEFLSKPVRLRELGAAIQRLLRPLQNE